MDCLAGGGGEGAKGMLENFRKENSRVVPVQRIYLELNTQFSVRS